MKKKLEITVLIRNFLRAVYSSTSEASAAIKVLSAIIIFAYANTIFANVTLTSGPVVAQLEIPTCAVTAGSGTLDFGSRSRGQLQELQGGMTPGVRTISVSVGCTLSRTMKLRFDGAANGTAFSWGGRKDSFLRVRALHAKLDGTPVNLQVMNSAGTPNGPSKDEQSILPGDVIVTVKNGLPLSGRQLTVTIEVVPVLGEQDSRPLQRLYSESMLNITLIQ